MEISTYGPFCLRVHGYFSVFISLLCYEHGHIHGPLLKNALLLQVERDFHGPFW